MESSDGHSFKREWWLSGSIIIGTLVGAAAALYFFSGDLSAQAAKIASDRAFAQNQTEVLGDFATLKSDAATAGPYTAAMDQLLPTHDALIGLPSWLTGEGSAHGVDVTAAFTGDSTPASKSAPGSDIFSLHASGSLNNILSFIDNLEAKSRQFLVNIQSLDISNRSGSYTLSAQGEAFSRPSTPQ